MEQERSCQTGKAFAIPDYLQMWEVGRMRILNETKTRLSHLKAGPMIWPLLYLWPHGTGKLPADIYRIALDSSLLSQTACDSPACLAVSL